MEEIQMQGWEPAEEDSGEVHAGWVALDEQDHYRVTQINQWWCWKEQTGQYNITPFVFTFHKSYLCLQLLKRQVLPFSIIYYLQKFLTWIDLKYIAFPPV